MQIVNRYDFMAFPLLRKDIAQLLFEDRMHGEDFRIEIKCGDRVLICSEKSIL
jgi:hypothetical protein